MKILLVRLREIGDVVFTTPAVRALRRAFPDAYISYLVEPLAAPIVSSSRDLSEVIVAPRQRLPADIRLGLALRAARYDLAIDFHGGPRASLLTWMSGAPRRIGYDVAGRGWMYTTRVARPRAWRPRHAVQNQWDLLAAIGLAPPTPSTDPVDMPIDFDASQSVARRVEADGARATDEVVVVHVSAGNPFRRWPQSSFATLVASLAVDHPHLRVLVTSGPSERDAAAQVVDQARTTLNASDGARIASLDCSLTELRALVDRAALFVGGDSGPLHIAATSHVPIVALYGPTLPVRSTPWRDPQWITESVDSGPLECRPCDQRVCAPGDFRCLTHLAPERVLAAAEKALSGARAAAPNTSSERRHACQ